MGNKKETIASLVAGTVYILILAVFFIFSGNSLDQVFIGLSPVLIHVGILMYTLSRRGDLTFSWVSPIALPLIFFFVWASNAIPTVSAMDGQSLAVWQCGLSFLITIIAALIVFIDFGSDTKKPKQRKNPKQETQTEPYRSQVPQAQAQTQPPVAHHTTHHHHHHAKQPPQTHVVHDLNQQQHDELVQIYDEQSKVHNERLSQLQEQLAASQAYNQQAQQYMAKHAQYQKQIQKLEDELTHTKKRMEVTKENFQVSLQEIEAKAKAINFVIGRVYADKKGGNAEIREMLHIDRELYNKFSEIAADFQEEDGKQMMQILEIIQNKLAIYELPEKELFKTKSDRDGSDAIIKVLSNNDQDPVVDYYTGAKDICEKVLAYLKNVV